MEEDPLGPDGRPRSEVAWGIENENVVPRFGVLSTQIRPPWASTMPLLIGRPSPAPCRFARAACQKRSKTRGSFSGAMPEPVSVIRKMTSCAFDAALTLIHPPGFVNLIALPIRFSNT